MPMLLFHYDEVWEMRKRNVWRIPAVITALLAVVLAVAIPITSFYSTMINAALGAETQKIIRGENSQDRKSVV